MTPRELAAAIRKGHTMIGEARWTFWSTSDNCGCALGAAFAGAGFTHKQVSDASSFESKKTHANFAPMLGISPELSLEISLKHCGGTPRLAIADWLDTLDPSQPKDAQTFERFMAATLAPVEVEESVR